MDGNGGYPHLTGNAFDYMLRAQRKAAVDQDRSQLLFFHRGFEQQQRAQLRIAVLFYDEADIVFCEESFRDAVEWETAYAQEIGADSEFGQPVDGFAHGQ